MSQNSEMLDICRKAQAIVDAHPELAFDDVRRVPMRLRLTPRQRLDRSLPRRKDLPRARKSGVPDLP